MLCERVGLIFLVGLVKFVTVRVIYLWGLVPKMWGMAAVCQAIMLVVPMREISVSVEIAATDAEITACYPVMSELRPHISDAEFVSRVRESEKSGYRLVYIQDGGVTVAVAGIRIGENLAWGRFLYVDDMVTAANQRSRGYGARMLTWIREYAVKARCTQLHLDSGMHRAGAHRFYERKGLFKAGFHFAETISVRL